MRVTLSRAEEAYIDDDYDAFVIGDFRDWDDIKAWAAQIAVELTNVEVKS